MAKMETTATQSQREFIENVPVFINVRDRLSCLLKLINWLECAGHQNITLIDNGSTYPPLVEFLGSTKYCIVRLKKNAGHTALWKIPKLRKILLKQWYVYTDPDVIPTEECPLNAVAYLHELLELFPDYLKAGLGLKIDDLPNHYHLKQEVVQWETALLGREISPGVVQADVDTTFALHRPGAPYIIGPAVRTRGRYEARHLPWYVDSKQVDSEERYYREHASSTVSNWNTSGGMRLTSSPAPGGITIRMENDPEGLLQEILNSNTGKIMTLIRKVRRLLLLSERSGDLKAQDQPLCRGAIVKTLTSQEWNLARSILNFIPRLTR